jgi:hypothetical protein
MATFAIDHVVIQTPDREAFVAAVARAAGLPVLQGYSAAGVVQSSGVRFANGPFLDVFGTPEPGTALILQGEVGAAERLARAQGWAVRSVRKGQRPAEAPDFPWSMALFRRGQGLLTRVSVIEYDHESEAWAEPDFSGELYRQAPEASARLTRVWLTTEDPARAERDLAAFGYVRAGEAGSGFWPHGGRRLTGPAADLVLVEGLEGVARLDIAAECPPRELALANTPRVVVGEA